MKKRYSLKLVLCALFLPFLGHSQIYTGSTTVSAANNMTVSVVVNTNSNMVQITMTGTNGSWFGYGFGGSSMSGTYALISNGTNTITERSLGAHTAGSVLTNSATIVSNTLSGSVRTMTVTRSITGMNGSYFTFPTSAQSFSIIWAKGSSSSFSQHASNSRGSSILTLQDACNFPNTVLPDVTVCSGDSAQIFGTWQSQAGVYSTTLTSSLGCDSIVEQELLVQTSISTTLPSIVLCNGDSAMIFGNYVSAAGNYSDTLSSSGGCDSIVDVTVSVESVNISVNQNGATLDASGSNGVSYDWFDCNTGVSTGISTAVFTATANGDYAVVVTTTNCSDTSSCFTVSGIGLDENDVAVLDAYPVPFNTTIHLTHLPKGGSLSITSITGEVIFEASNLSGELEIETSAWPTGMYIVSARNSEGETATSKIVKE